MPDTVTQGVRGEMGADDALPTTETWEEAAVRSARDNHIWLNAFRCVRPTDDFMREVGQAVIDMLNNPDNLIPPEFPLLKDTPSERYEYQLVLRVNKS